MKARRLSNIPKNTNFLSTIKLALLEFGKSFNITYSEYFANKLFFTGKNAKVQFLNMFQSNNDKYLKLDEFLIILDTLENTQQKIILDDLCQRYDFICSSKATNNKQTINNENIKDILLKISGTNGKLFTDFLDFNTDKNLDNKELKSLIDSSYQARVRLLEFETICQDLLINRC